MAYRGRVLVELSTQLDGKIDKNVDDICSDDVLVAQVCEAWNAGCLSASCISRRVPHPCEPGTTEAFFLLNGVFSCNCSSLRGQPLGFCNAPRENLQRNRCCINKVKLK